MFFIAILYTLFIFYSVYEIGGLINDLTAYNEKDGQPTLRIKSGLKINSILFVLIRFLFVSLILFIYICKGYNPTVYALGLLICLFIYLLHSIIRNNIRLITFVLLKIFRNLIPLLAFINLVKINTLIIIFLTFFCWILH